MAAAAATRVAGELKDSGGTQPVKDFGVESRAISCIWVGQTVQQHEVGRRASVSLGGVCWTLATADSWASRHTQLWLRSYTFLNKSL